MFESWIKPQLLKMHTQGFITKQTLLDAIKTGSMLPLIDQRAQAARSIQGEAFRWIFQLLFAPDIINVLSQKDYGTVLSERQTRVPISLLRDMGLYLDGENEFNERMQRRLGTIIKSMFFTTDLSEIYRILNTNVL